MSEVVTGSSDPSDRTTAAFKTLIVAANNVNTLSGEFAKPIASLERALQRLHVGVACWTQVRLNSDGRTYEGDDVGYARVEGKWRLAIRTTRGWEGDPESEIQELWPFNEAPLYLRIKAVDKIADLIQALIEASNAMVERLNKKIPPAQELAAAVNVLTNAKKR